MCVFAAEKSFNEIKLSITGFIKSFWTMCPKYFPESYAAAYFVNYNLKPSILIPSKNSKMLYMFGKTFINDK